MRLSSEVCKAKPINPQNATTSDDEIAVESAEENDLPEWLLDEIEILRQPKKES